MSDPQSWKDMRFGNDYVPGSNVLPCLKAGVQVTRNVANTLDVPARPVAAAFVSYVGFQVAIRIFGPGVVSRLATGTFVAQTWLSADGHQDTPGQTAENFASFVLGAALNKMGGGPPSSRSPSAPKSGGVNGGGPSEGPSGGTQPGETPPPASATPPAQPPTPPTVPPASPPSGPPPPPGAPTPAASLPPFKLRVVQIGDGTLPSFTDVDLNFENARVGPLIEVPGQSPTNPNVGLQKVVQKPAYPYDPANPPDPTNPDVVKVPHDPTKIDYHENMLFKDIQGLPGQKVQVRWHTTDPNAPGGNSAAGPTTIVDTKVNSGPNVRRVPGGDWKRMADMTDAEKNDHHMPFQDR